MRSILTFESIYIENKSLFILSSDQRNRLCVKCMLCWNKHFGSKKYFIPPNIMLDGSTFTPWKLRHQRVIPPTEYTKRKTGLSNRLYNTGKSFQIYSVRRKGWLKDPRTWTYQPQLVNILALKKLKYNFCISVTKLIKDCLPSSCKVSKEANAAIAKVRGSHLIET